ncbi:hypothetical protein ACFFLM_08730 [Deinococcus oregonensis]|uniref:Uncharacterized protein n=1 Tax=Deinococcus oregonensis TaxID=1805970 RepID=A0ABV6AX01_9DEIO
MTELEAAALIRLARLSIGLPDPAWDADAFAAAQRKTADEVQSTLRSLVFSKMISGHVQSATGVVGNPTATEHGIRELLFQTMDVTPVLEDYDPISFDIIEYLVEHGQSTVQALEKHIGLTADRLQSYLRLMRAMGHATAKVNPGGRISNVSLG